MKLLNKMLIAGIGVVFTVTVNLFAFSATVTALEGDIKYVKKGSAGWQPAAVGSVLSDGDKISTKQESWAELSFSIGHQVRLGSNSDMTINNIGPKTSLEMFKGDLLSKVRKLAKAESYEVKTPQSVASVKGTEFSVVIIGEDTKIIVFEGNVLAKEIDTGAEIIVSAGKYTIVVKGQAPSPLDDIENMKKDEQPGGEELAEAEKEEEPADDQAELEGEEEPAEQEEAEEKTEGEVEGFKESFRQEIRQEIREAVQDIKIDIDTARDVIEEERKNDAATGRTLRDIHGNLVRVEQYILRPQPEIIQLINITKRSDYKYGGRMKVSETGARLDSYDARITFNMGLPDKISDWVDFFIDIDENDIDFHPVAMRIETTNKSDSIIVTADWNEVKEELNDPVIKLKSGIDDTEWIVDTKEYDDLDSLRLTDEDQGSGVFWDNSDNLEAWMISPNMRLFQDSPGGTQNIYDAGETDRLVRLGQEMWVFDNDGKIIGIDTFEGLERGGNPFELIRNIAFEMSLVFRYDIPGGSKLDMIDVDEDLLTDADYANILASYNGGKDFFKNNIDLVITPDLMISIIEQMAQNIDLSKLDTDSDNDKDVSQNKFGVEGSF